MDARQNTGLVIGILGGQARSGGAYSAYGDY